jgi:VWFA-related protein
MRKFLVALLLVAAASAISTAQQPTFPSRVEVVTVDAVVFDDAGNPVEGLTANDFVVKEDGVAQRVSAFEAVALRESPSTPQRRQRVSTNDERPDAAGRWFFVVFDDVNITQFATPRAREAVVHFIERALAPGDRVMIAPASGGSNWIGELPQDREDLLAFVQRLQGERRIQRGPSRIWDHEAIGIALGRDPQARAQVLRRFFENDILIEGGVTNSPTPEGRQRSQELDTNAGAVMVQTMARQVYTEARSRMQVSLGTLERMSKALADARGRKTLLFFSEGFIMDNTLPAFRNLLQAARNANVAVHFVDVGSPDGAIGEAGAGASAETARAAEDRDALISQAMALRESEGTRSIAADTGGSVVTGTDLLAGLTRIARESRSYYLLGYSPTNTRRDGKFRKIEVTVNRPGVTVRARGGYFAATSERETPKADPDTLDPDVRAALDSPFGAPDIPMRLTSYVLGPQIGGKVLTLLVAEADLAPLRLQPRSGIYAATFDSYVLVHDRDNDALERNERLVELNMPPEAFAQVSARGLPLQREFTLAPGRYQATILLRDRATGTIGSVRHEFEVPAPRAFRITTPIITDVIQPGTAQGQARPVPIASRTFQAGSRIAAAFEILGVSAAGTNPPAVSVSYALKRADGTTVTSIPPQPLKPNAAGQFGVTIGITLPQGAAGDHELVLSVRDEQAVRVIEHVEPLEIVANR